MGGLAGDADGADPTDPEDGTPGASLRREYERRRASREERIRTNHKYLGRMMLALSDEPASTKALAVGALGEERLAARLQQDCAPTVLFLHNRKLGRGRRGGDIDHVAIAPSGIYLIDAKRYPDKKVRVERRGGILAPVTEHLMIGGRDRSKLLDGCDKQVAAVSDALGDHPLVGTVTVTPLLCFVEALLPMFGKPTARGVRLVGPKATVKMLRSEGALDAEARQSLHRHLGFMLPPA